MICIRMSTQSISKFFVFFASVVLCSVSADSFVGDPPDMYHPWAVHDSNRPQPPRVEPGKRCGEAPSDAVILFDGSEASFSNWKHERPDSMRKQDWLVKDGALQCAPSSGFIATKEEFGDCQLHIEWAAPTPVHGDGQARGNSGVFLMGMVEVQVLDNYQNPTYADGTAGAVYGVMPPAANALRAPGEWQSYDIIFRRPIVRGGEVLDAGSMTVLCNGVVLQDSTALEGGGGWKKRKSPNRAFPERGSLKLQDHGNPVRYRNIWIRPLRPRQFDGGTDGRISPEASLQARAEIAATIRQDAATQQGVVRAMRLLESLLYEDNAAARVESNQLIADYLAPLFGAAPGSISAQQGTVKLLAGALHYMQQHTLISETDSELLKVNAIAMEQGWKLPR
ncbi:MAG: hypothetical protein ABS34_06195 [Opitutaceae bacterium BACL24 MAG-120322-bin51]|jgi:hypothetical protein|nr:MAG: hypothetical protein ABS34_06195 [Opitutaceae bacterium BACL24 MAG-120322-bin51]